MSRRVEIGVFVVLLLVLGFVLYRAFRPARPMAARALASDGTFHPLDVQEPQLHLDLLENLRKKEYADPRRNIFTAAAIPPPTTVPVKRETGPRVPPPPPPLEVPVQFFGYASETNSGRRVGFFASGDNVLVLAQGDDFLGRYRLLSISNKSAEVMEISTGRRATLPITEPPGQAEN